MKKCIGSSNIGVQYGVDDSIKVKNIKKNKQTGNNNTMKSLQSQMSIDTGQNLRDKYR